MAVEPYSDSKIRSGRAVREQVSYCLPPYSPDFNPIENAFAKLKAMLRAAAARTRDELWDAIRNAPPSSPRQYAQTTPPPQATSRNDGNLL